MHSILIFAYYSYKDPVFQSAVLPYFLNFPEKENFQFILLTFEHSKYTLTNQEEERISQMLSAHNIEWVRTHWRSGRFKLFKKALDFVSSIWRSVQLIKKYNVTAVYSEGFPGAILSYYVCRLTGHKHMVHTFEPHADYMVESGVWNDSSWETKLLRLHEMKIAKHATYIFTATTLMIERLKSLGVKPQALHRVPSCVDLEVFKYDPVKRKSIREYLGIRHDQPVLVYLGKFGGMYMEDEAFEFFRYCQKQKNCWIMILTQDPYEKIFELAKKHSITKDLTIKAIDRQDVPGYLSAADMGFVGIRQIASRKYSSPIKTGEYLACGIPVIVPAGISDDDELMAQKGIGLLLESTNKVDFASVMSAWEQLLLLSTPDDIRKKAIEYVREDRSISYYQHVYNALFKEL